MSDVMGDIEHSRDEYPRLEGDTIVIGPACFAACDGSVLNWRGVNYVPQDHLRGAVDDPRLIETLARVIENRHGTLRGIGSTLREALAEYKRGQ